MSGVFYHRWAFGGGRIDPSEIRFFVLYAFRGDDTLCFVLVRRRFFSIR